MRVYEWMCQALLARVLLDVRLSAPWPSELPIDGGTPRVGEQGKRGADSLCI